VQSVLDLYNAVREQFPAATALADRVHVRQWGELDPAFSYSWFESLAYALNGEMSREEPYETHEPLFLFLAKALVQRGDAVHNCIDVAFVENLFWQVPAEKRACYWQRLPSSLRELYVAFHRREP
jgi:hypothetical protein